MIKKNKNLFTLGWFLYLINISIGQSIKYDIKLDLDTTKQTCIINAVIKLEDNKFKKSDTIWFYLPFNAYSTKYNTFTDDLKRISSSSNYFFRKEKDMSQMKDLIIKSGDNPIPFFYKNEFEREFVGFIMDGQDLSFSYKLKLPALVNGLGYLNGNYFLRHFYPQLAMEDGKWNFKGTSLYFPKKLPKAGVTIHLDQIDDFEFYSNGSVQDDKKNYVFKADNTNDFYIHLIQRNASFKKYEGHFMSAGRLVSYSILHLGNPKDSVWNQVNMNFNKATEYLNTHLGSYPHQHLNMTIFKNCLQCFEGESFVSTNDIDMEEHKHLEFFLASSLSPLWVSSNFNGFNDENYWMLSGLSNYFEYNYFQNLLTEEDFKENRKEFILSTDEKVHEYRKQKILMPLTTDEKKLDGNQSYLNRFVQSRDFFRYASKLVGKDIFDQTILSFYKDQSRLNLENFISKLESQSGKSLNTALTSYAESAQYPDYTINKVAQNGEDITIDFENKGEASLPFPLNIVYQNGRVEERIVDGFFGKQSLTIDDIDLTLVQTLSIDKDGVIPDKNRENNHFFPAKRNHGNLKSTFFLVDNRSDRKEMFWTLFPAYNSNDGFMAGGVFSNANYSSYKKFKYAISPMYSVRNKAMVGQTWAEYDHFLKSDIFDRLTFYSGVKSYHMVYVKKEIPVNSFEYALRYIKIDPTISLRFRVPEVLGKTATLSLRSLIIFEEMPNFIGEGTFTGKSTGRSHIHQLTYDSKINQKISKFDLNVLAEQQSYDRENYLKLTASTKIERMYKKDKNISLRAFVGGFLMNTQRKSGSFQNIFTRGSLALIQHGFNDYTYDEYFFSRQNQSLLHDDQVSLINGGGFKTPVGSAHSIGMSNDFVAAINVSAHLPFSTNFFPIKAYFDMGTFTTFSDDKRVNNLMYNAGFMLNYEDFLTINVPLLFSSDLENIYKSEHKNFFSRISFSLNLHKLSPWKDNFE